MPTLAHPLTQSQIDAASKFWDKHLESGEFTQLNKAFPGRLEAIPIKAIVVNALYGTKVYAISKVAYRLKALLENTRTTGRNLVEEIVQDTIIQQSVNGRKLYSFAAKFAHFFIDDTLPILDSYAEALAAWHLGKDQSKESKRYLRFCENIDTLVKLADLTHSCANLDHYLWIAGEYWSWSQNRKREIYPYLKLHFENLHNNPENEPILRELLGPIFQP